MLRAARDCHLLPAIHKLSAPTFASSGIQATSSHRRGAAAPPPPLPLPPRPPPTAAGTPAPRPVTSLSSCASSASKKRHGAFSSTSWCMEMKRDGERWGEAERRRKRHGGRDKWQHQQQRQQRKLSWVSTYVHENLC